LRPWRRETREVRWSTAAALLSAGVEEAEESTAVISFSARRWLTRTVDRRATSGTRTSWYSSRAASAARVCRPAAADGSVDGDGHLHLFWVDREERVVDSLILANWIRLPV
jgi:hypothetical protein